MDNKQLLTELTEKVNNMLTEYLPNPKDSVTSDAVNYSVKAGGKRLRPLLLLEVFKLFDNGTEDYKLKTAECFAAALEFIHTYSLVHDDLPDMDNDLYRRGKLTTHAKYGGAMGVLAGDALLNEAFSIVSHKLLELAENKDVKKDFLKRAIKAEGILADFAGMNGMILGQEIDLKSEGKKISDEKLLLMYELKTSRLLQAAFGIGAVLGGCTKKQEENALLAALSLGKAFQVQDDILDVTGDEKKLGKPVFSDVRNDKKTYAAIVGLEKAKEQSETFTNDAINALKKLPGDTAFLEWLMRMLIERES